MKKIVIVGTSGSGKTTLGKKISGILKYNFFDLDDYYWLPNWQAREPQEFEEKVNELICRAPWIMSGNYSKVQELIWKNFDTIIWLDYSFTRCLYQGFLRSLRRVFFRIPCCGNNFENIKRLFSKDSIILWIINTYKRRKDLYNKLFENPEKDKKYIRFKNPKEADYWLEKLGENQ